MVVATYMSRNWNIRDEVWRGWRTQSTFKVVPNLSVSALEVEGGLAS